MERLPALCRDGLVQPGEGTALEAPNNDAPVPIGRSSRKQDELFTTLQCRDMRHQPDFMMRTKRLSRLPRGAERPQSQEVFKTQQHSVVKNVVQFHC